MQSISLSDTKPMDTRYSSNSAKVAVNGVIRVGFAVDVGILVGKGVVVEVGIIVGDGGTTVASAIVICAGGVEHDAIATKTNKNSSFFISLPVIGYFIMA